jgi:hypothetical protein
VQLAISAAAVASGTSDGMTQAVYYISLCSFGISFLNIFMNFPGMLSDHEKEEQKVLVSLVKSLFSFLRTSLFCYLGSTC